MKIGFVSTYPPTHCGVGEYTRMLVTSLRSLYPDGEFYVFADKSLVDEYRFDELAKAMIIPAFKHREEKYSGLLDKLVEVNGVDILHVQHEYGIFGRHNGLINALREAIDEELVKRTIITMHTVKHPLSGEKEAIVFQRELNFFDKVIVHSFLQEFELLHQGILPEKIARIPHGTLLNPYLWKPRHVLIEELGLNPKNIHGFILAVPGFLRRDKGLDLLIDAIKPLLHSRGDYTVIVAGEIRDYSLKEEVEEMVRNGPNLVFINRFLRSDEILRVVALVDAVILPYRDKIGTYSVSGILHLSMGGLKPIIGTRAPRLIELYVYAPRLTVPPRNPIELRRKIKWLRENYELIIPYMSQLYSYAVRTEWRRMARRHLILYKQLLSS